MNGKTVSKNKWKKKQIKMKTKCMKNVHIHSYTYFYIPKSRYRTKESKRSGEIEAKEGQNCGKRRDVKEKERIGNKVLMCLV